MGMFDSVYINVKCPFCGEESEKECQTKDTDCSLDVWRKGEYIGTKKYNDLDCLAGCESETCKAWVVKEFGYWGGFGRPIYLRVFLKDGVVTGEYQIASALEDE